MTDATIIDLEANKAQNCRLLPKVSNLENEIAFLTPEAFALKAQRWSQYPRIIVKNPDGQHNVLNVDSDGVSKDNAMVQKVITGTMHLTGTSMNLGRHEVKRESNSNQIQRQNPTTQASWKQVQDPDTQSQHSALILNNFQDLSTSVREFINYTNQQMSQHSEKEYDGVELPRHPIITENGGNQTSITCTYSASIHNGS